MFPSKPPPADAARQNKIAALNFRGGAATPPFVRDPGAEFFPPPLAGRAALAGEDGLQGGRVSSPARRAHRRDRRLGEPVFFLCGRNRAADFFAPAG